jgi:hypothetical protein
MRTEVQEGAVGDRRAALEIKTIVVTFRSAKHFGGDVDGARQRAEQLLDRVAVKIESQPDEELQALLHAARRQIRSP